MALKSNVVHLCVVIFPAFPDTLYKETEPLLKTGKATRD